MFTIDEYNQLHSLVFKPDYSGWKPNVLEIPNGDGRIDDLKQYAHVAPKYLQTDQQRKDLMPFLLKAFGDACDIAEYVGLAKKYWPTLEHGALRVLDYPAGAVSNKHQDFDLFTIMMHRDQPEMFKAYDVDQPSECLAKMRTINPQLHLGELGELIGLGKATPHEVLPSHARQHSVVYFVIPDHNALLPSGLTVRDWLNERMARSRTEFKAYE